MYIDLLCFIAMLKITCYEEEAVRDLQNVSVRRESEKSKSELAAISKAHHEKIKDE
jgi:hypothetical protein